MSKLLLCLALALVAVSAVQAQAVTFSWQARLLLPAEAVQSNCLYNDAGAQTCAAFGTTVPGFYTVPFECMGSDGTQGTNADCDSPKPAQSDVPLADRQLSYGCNALKVCSEFYYTTVGYSQCVRKTKLSSAEITLSNSNFCYTAGTTAPEAVQYAINQCYQGGVAVKDEACTNAGVAKPSLTTTPQITSVPCTLLPCIPQAIYLPIGLGQCINTDSGATCCARDEPVPETDLRTTKTTGYTPTQQPFCAQVNGAAGKAKAPTLYQCTYNGEGYPGQCPAAYPNPQPSYPDETATTDQTVLDAYFTSCSLPLCGIQGDPEFVGFRGQRYEIHGIPGSIFNIISSPNVQYNAEFVFLGAKSDRQCDVERTHPWTHPGTYLGQLGFQIGEEKVQIWPGDCETGITKVLVNGKELSVGDVHHFKGAHKQSLQYTDEFTLHMALHELDITLENSDNFFNQEVSLTKAGQRTKTMHGLLGQTWSTKTYKDAQGHKHFIEGHPNDYLIQDDDIFGSDFMFNLFKQ